MDIQAVILQGLWLPRAFKSRPDCQGHGLGECNMLERPWRVTPATVQPRRRGKGSYMQLQDPRIGLSPEAWPPSPCEAHSVLGN